MKLKSSLCLLVMLWMVSALSPAAAQRHERTREDGEWSERDETRQTFQLTPGTRVEVRSLNGTLEISTGPGNTAEVHIVRLARNRESLNFKRVIVEHNASGLTIRGENERENGGDRDRAVRHLVTLKLPRQVDLGVEGINGRCTVGEIDGPVSVGGVNGAVEIAQAMGYSELRGINGKVGITIARLGERGIRVDGINGGVELRFVDEVNAEIDVDGINGSVNATDIPNVILRGKIDRQNFHATIGTGGSPIRVSGVNGHVKLVRAGS